MPPFVSPPTPANVRPGALIRLRRRVWRVDEVAGEILAATPIDDFGAPRQRFHLPTEAAESATLPPPDLNTIGDYGLQKLFLQAVRLDALHGTAPFLSLQRTGVVPVEYQLVPLIMALRQEPVRLLLADAVGLGKTIEAGLIVSELMARGRARRILIVTPAALREQWEEQLRTLFYLYFTVISGERRRSIERNMPPGADPWVYYDRLIVSLDYAKEPAIRAEITKKQARWDLVVVDETHNAAMPHQQSGRRADMERWHLVRDVARSSRHLLLLTATPHNGYTDSFASLLEMLSSELVTGTGPGLQPRRQVALRHVCQRTRADVRDWFAQAGARFPFPERQSGPETEVAVSLEPAYAAILSRLDETLEYVTRLAAGRQRQQAAEWLRLHFHRRALSSPAALRQSLENRIDRLTRIAEEPEADVDLAAAEPLFQALTDRGRADVATEDEQDRAADLASLHVEERAQLRQFDALLNDLRRLRPAQDRKLAALRDQVLPGLFQGATQQQPARAIVFTRFKDTLDYLVEELTRHRARDYELFALHGDLSPAAREQQMAQFSAASRAVLIATDVISEGLNLQSACCRIVHYDLPWNPNRLEQRVGRVDRFGQVSPMVYVRTLYCRDTTDEDVMQLLVRKLAEIQRTLGISPPFFASEETVLRVLSRRSRRRKRRVAAEQLSLLEPPAAPDTPEADEELFDPAALHRVRSEGFYGQAGLRVPEVAERLQATRARIGSPKAIRDFILTGLRHYGCSVKPLPGAGQAECWRIQVSNPRLRALGVSEVIERAALDPQLRQERPDVEILDVGHPLIRRLNAIIREDALQDGEQTAPLANPEHRTPHTAPPTPNAQGLTPTSPGARVAAFAVAGQRETRALGRGLLRVVARTAPPTLLEEVVTFGIRSDLSGVQALSAAEIEEAETAAPSAMEVERAAARDRLHRLCAAEWTAAEAAARQQALERLRQYRAGLAVELSAAAETDSAWLSGFADLEVAGFDLYTITLTLPDLAHG